MTTATARKELHALARASGVDPAWRDMHRVTHTCSDETLLAMVQLVGLDVARPEDARRARRDLAAAQAERLIDPVTVAWDGAPPVVRLHGVAAAAERVEITVEGVCEVSYTTPHTRPVQLPDGLPYGRHRVTVEVDRGRAGGEGWILSAPSHIGRAALDRAWGVFAPVYALHDRDQRETGDLRSLARLAEWGHWRGAAIVGTLPLLATFVGHGDEPCDPSPYAPVSRRFWNEVYLDLRALPELDGDVSVVEPAPGRYVDLPRLAAARRPLLERAVERLDRAPARKAAFSTWLDFRPDVDAYARFRAAREGSADTGRRVHAYAQWMLDEQLSRLAADATQRDQLLYFDLPVGAHRDGFDVEAEGDLFLRDASVGAPPDNFFAGGQDWGFPPLRPEIARTTGHAYLAACVRAHVQYARALRVDHVMGLHRLWVIPPGMPSSAGAYLRYPSEEQWAAVCIEAARADATVIGENLGTVPAEADRSLRRHRALGMWVAQFDLPPATDADASARATPPSNDLAALGTHDLPMFATWWADLAPDTRDGLLDLLRRAGELQTTDHGAAATETVLAALLAWMGRSRAPAVLVALEDLWLEREPQNVPGHGQDLKPFSRRFAHGLDELDNLDLVKQGIERLDRARHAPTHRRGRRVS